MTVDRELSLTVTQLIDAPVGFEVISQLGNIWQKREDGMWNCLTLPYGPSPTHYLPVVWVR